MLLIVEDAADKRAAQEALESAVRRQLADQGTRNIGFPSGNVDERIYSNGVGKLWAAFRDLSDAEVPRSWNAFGVYNPQKNTQIITAEINIPTQSNSALVAGFFARDPTTGFVYLMHDGSIGGGKKGVGRAAFLAWSMAELEDVWRNDGSYRHGLVVGRVDSANIVGRIWYFVQRVRGFKEAVRRGDLDDPKMQQNIGEWENFRSESSGRRRGKRRSEIDYFSYHGEVVERLFEERKAQCVDGEYVSNNGLIDLYVRKGLSMTEIYEVKTSADRQSIYKAIGQLLCHSTDAPPSIKRTLILPNGHIASDLGESLKSLSIELRRFSISSGNLPEVTLS